MEKKAAKSHIWEDDIILQSVSLKNDYKGSNLF